MQVICADKIALGPGKADLLDAIDAHGSISAAARVLGLSYRRAWLMVDVMNHCWTQPLVDATKGGRKGAKLSDNGHNILLYYRDLEAKFEKLSSDQSARFLMAGLQDQDSS